jgi:hypothetical protein
MVKKSIKKTRHFIGFSLFHVLFMGAIADGLAVVWILGLF